MAAQTLGEMKAELKLQIGQRTDLDSYVTRKLNEALLDMVILTRPPTLLDTKTIATVAGTAEYALQAAAKEVFFILTVKNITASKVARLRRGTLTDLDGQDLTLKGRPSRWVRTSLDKITFYRLVPDAVYTMQIRFLKRPTFMVADGDSFPLDVEFEEPTKLLAASKLFNLINEPDKAGAKSAEFQALSVIRETHEQAEDEWDDDAGVRPVF